MKRLHLTRSGGGMLRLTPILRPPIGELLSVIERISTGRASDNEPTFIDRGGCDDA